MPTYSLTCENCNYNEEYILPLSSWDGLDMSKGETPYPTKCPKCKSKKYLRDTQVNIAVKGSVEKQKSNLLGQVRQDLRNLASGDEKTILDIAGGPRGASKVSSGVKYMKDVKSKGFKRR